MRPSGEETWARVRAHENGGFQSFQGNVGVVIDGVGAGNIEESLALAAVNLINSTNWKVIVSKQPEGGSTDASYG